MSRPSGSPSDQLTRSLARRNVNLPGGKLEIPGLSLNVRPVGEFVDEGEIGGVVVATKDGYPLYMRDLAEITRGYVDPPIDHELPDRQGRRPGALPGPGCRANPAPQADPKGPVPDRYQLQTTRAITLAVRQIKGTQIAAFGRETSRTSLAALKGVLPEDLKVEWTSDEPERVVRKIELFDQNLLEAIGIVIVVALIFMEWRSALLVALSIPLTIAMTLGFCALIGIDLQQISIAALIIALGLLVDDPVVAGDAINREIAHGTPRDVAAWLGPQKLAHAILFATLTNIVAFLPLLLVSGKTGEFIYSLPIVVTASLVASRIVSMTFIPLLGYYLLRGQAGMESGLAEGGKGSRFARLYNGFSEWCLDHRWSSLGACLVILAARDRLPADDRHGVLPQGLARHLHDQRLHARRDTDPRDSRRGPQGRRRGRRPGRPRGPGVHHVRRRGGPPVLALRGPRAAGRPLRASPGPYHGHPTRPRSWSTS